MKKIIIKNRVVILFTALLLSIACNPFFDAPIFKAQLTQSECGSVHTFFRIISTKPIIPTVEFDAVVGLPIGTTFKYNGVDYTYLGIQSSSLVEFNGRFILTKTAVFE